MTNNLVLLDSNSAANNLMGYHFKYSGYWFEIFIYRTDKRIKSALEYYRPLIIDAVNLINEGHAKSCQTWELVSYCYFDYYYNEFLIKTELGTIRLLLIRNSLVTGRRIKFGTLKFQKMVIDLIISRQEGRCV